jgi:hypothetical protein
MAPRYRYEYWIVDEEVAHYQAKVRFRMSLNPEHDQDSMFDPNLSEAKRETISAYANVSN